VCISTPSSTCVSSRSASAAPAIADVGLAEKARRPASDAAANAVVSAWWNCAFQRAACICSVAREGPIRVDRQRARGHRRQSHRGAGGAARDLNGALRRRCGQRARSAMIPAARGIRG